jgi:DDE superfamily endonuclease
MQRRGILRAYLRLRYDQWTFPTKLVIAKELRRLQKQLRLQNSARIRVWSSSFNINAVSDSDCLIWYIFKRNDIGFIAGIIPWENGLDFNGKMRTSRRRYYIDQLEASSILLRRLATPCSRVDLHEEFGKHSSALAEIFYHAMELLHSKFSPLVHVWPKNIVRERAAYYEKCVTERWAVLPHVVGFIDGTSLEIVRPKGNAQRATYSGHKRRKCINFQAISTPDGCILHLFGPMEGRRHDMTLYRESSIDQALQASLLVDGVQYYIYGDPAYCLRPCLQAGSKRSDRTSETSYSTHLWREFASQSNGHSEMWSSISHIWLSRES